MEKERPKSSSNMPIMPPNIHHAPPKKERPIPKHKPRHKPNRGILENLIYKYYRHRDKMKYYKKKCQKHRHHRRKFGYYYDYYKHHKDRMHHYYSQCYPDSYGAGSSYDTSSSYDSSGGSSGCQCGCQCGCGGDSSSRL